MDKIRIGVIGLGFGQLHVRTLVNMEEAHLVAVADHTTGAPDRLRTVAEQYGIKGYHDGLEMLEQETLDAVSLCVAPSAREKLIEEAIRRKIALFVEKPWAANVEQARHLATICQQADAPIMVGFSFRFHPALVKLRTLMEGPLGKGWLLNGDYSFDWLPPAGYWLWDFNRGGGFFNENSCHLFDVVCALLGQPVSVMAEGAIFKGSPSEEVAAISLRFAGGAIAALTVGGLGIGTQPGTPRLNLATANGQAHLTGRDHIWQQLTWTLRGSEEAQLFTALPEALGRTRYTDAFHHFFSCLRSGEKPTATIEDGIRSVALAEAVYESMHTGRKVLLTL
jgi:predicted dehydrogenase